MSSSGPERVDCFSVFSVAEPSALLRILEAVSLLGVLPSIRSVTAAMRLAGRVLWDIVIANITVARLVLGPVSRLRPAFVKVPLTATHPYAISLFSSMISITPGSIPLALAPDARTLLVHVLHVEDEKAFIINVKERYERPLMEILEC